MKVKLEIAKQKQLLMKKHVEQQKVTWTHFVTYFINLLVLEIVFFPILSQ